MKKKFRVYIKPENRYDASGDSIYYWQEDKEGHWSLTTSTGVEYKGDELVVEQWIGDNERCGKGIYEGDIVQQVSESWWEYDENGENGVWTRHELDYVEAPIEVEWDDSEYGWVPFLNGCGLCREIGWFLPEDCIVIGNIHDGIDHRKKWEEDLRPHMSDEFKKWSEDHKYDIFPGMKEREEKEKAEKEKSDE